MTIFVFGLHYEFHWLNFRLMFYRLPNLGATPFRPTSDSEHIFFIRIYFCLYRARVRDCCIDIDDDVGDKLKMSVTDNVEDFVIVTDIKFW